MGSWPLRGDGQRFEAAGADTSDTTGVTVTSGVSSNAKGSYAEIIAATAFDASGFYIEWNEITTHVALIDIAIGASGAEEIIIPNLYLQSRSGKWFGHNIFIPISIPAGTRISARHQGSSGSRTAYVVITLVGVGFLPSAPNSRAEAHGADIANSKGTVIDCGGVADTKGAWVELAASTAFDMRELIILLGANENVALTFGYLLFDLAIGASGSEEILIPDFFVVFNSAPDTVQPDVIGPIPIQIPAGSRIAMRGQTSIIDATDRVFDTTVIGLG